MKGLQLKMKRVHFIGGTSKPGKTSASSEAERYTLKKIIGNGNL